ncbi:hypothetical protein ACFWVP_12830 [Streptomyces sp. NPDC058637]|uniref:hypothetical protein n=1 Tax=Streptomyces sp. NPDC058637 TaxID=3346569 RepID=UPI0036584167
MISGVTSGAIAGAGPGGDEADAWRERLGRAFGPIADDPAERAAALAHLRGAKANTRAALDRFNELWRLTRPLGTEEQYQEPSFRRAHEVYIDIRSRSLPDGLWEGADGPGLPYALLFLEWEARFPGEWTEHAKAWGTEQWLIRSVAVADHDQPTREKLADLVEIVVRRAYRCKDVSTFASHGRSTASISATDSVRPPRRTTHGHDFTPAMFSGLLEHPEAPNTRRGGRTWVSEASGKQSGPADPDR